MNILIDELPNSVEIDGQSYKIRPNFRNILLIEQALNDSELPEGMRLIKIIELFYADVPEDLSEAFNQFMIFYSRNSRPSKESEGGSAVSHVSSEHDAAYIYTAFLRTYQINLNHIDFLHWHEYCAMFEDLDKECVLSQAIYYRKVPATDISDKKAREHHIKMQKLFALPGDEAVQDWIDKIEDALMNGGDISAFR